MPLLKCLQPQIDLSCIHSAVSLFPPSQSPDPLSFEAELQVLSELLPSDVGKFYFPRGRGSQGDRHDQACINLTIDIEPLLWNDICCNVLLNASPGSLPPQLVVQRGKDWEGGYGDFSNIVGGTNKIRATQQHWKGGGVMEYGSF